tara:strand:+ start:232526 stop:233560 length:1035 start_codon:yes stop_codon:yes gene_type:complete
MAEAFNKNSSEAPTAPGIRGYSADTDPCETEYNVRPWQLMVRPRQAGCFASQRDYLALPDVLVYLEHYEGSTVLSGHTPNDMFAVVLPYTGSGSRYFDRPPASGEMLAGFDSPVDVRTGTQHRHLVILIKRTFLARELLAETLLRLEQQTYPRWLTVGNAGRDRLTAIVTTLLESTSNSPALLCSSATIDAMQSDIAQTASTLILSGQTRVRDQSHTRRRRALELSLQYLREAMGNDEPELPRITDLCELAGVSQRTLQYAFIDQLGITPKRYLTCIRYHRLRQHLLLKTTGTVQEAALSLGLYELGRVAGEYRSMFGENPSQTLHRPAATEPFPANWHNANFA